MDSIGIEGGGAPLPPNPTSHPTSGTGISLADTLVVTGIHQSPHAAPPVPPNEAKSKDIAANKTKVRIHFDTNKPIHWLWMDGLIYVDMIG